MHLKGTSTIKWMQTEIKSGAKKVLQNITWCYLSLMVVVILWFSFCLIVFWGFFTSSSEQIGTGQIPTAWKICLGLSSAFSRRGVYICFHFSIYWVWNFLFEICSSFLSVYIVILQNLFLFSIFKWESRKEAFDWKEKSIWGK